MGRRRDGKYSVVATARPEQYANKSAPQSDFMGPIAGVKSVIPSCSRLASWVTPAEVHSHLARRNSFGVPHHARSDSAVQVAPQQHWLGHGLRVFPAPPACPFWRPRPESLAARLPQSDRRVARRVSLAASPAWRVLRATRGEPARGRALRQSRCEAFRAWTLALR